MDLPPHPPLTKVVTFSYPDAPPPVLSTLDCSQHRGPSLVERQSEFDSEPSSSWRPSRSALLEMSGRNSTLCLVLLALLCLLAGTAAGGISGYYIAATRTVIKCGQGTVLAGNECIVEAKSM
mmetsp:Transcript_27804/g.77671  ORF Transcript_27804/g.77671 Transcript_27804/m.77671 type:complete len:122 (-) Transcript_27804:1010-1375(-)|eukprot:scaffold74073_cov36-Tisochrysis_lutea.AAC.4